MFLHIDYLRKWEARGLKEGLPERKKKKKDTALERRKGSEKPFCLWKEGSEKPSWRKDPGDQGVCVEVTARGC